MNTLRLDKQREIKLADKAILHNMCTDNYGQIAFVLTKRPLCDTPQRSNQTAATLKPEALRVNITLLLLQPDPYLNLFNTYSI